MPDRIREILYEISLIAQVPRVKELAAELGDLLADKIAQQDDALEIYASNADQQTDAAVDRFSHLDQLVASLRAEMHQMRGDIGDRLDNLSSKQHQMSSFMMGVELKVDELAEAITMLVNDSITTDERSS